MKNILFLSMIFIIISNNLFAQSISTNAQVYSFEINDVFHYKEEMSSPDSGYLMETIIEIDDKYYSANHDTVYYVRSIIKRGQGSNMPTTYEYFKDTISYTDLDSLVYDGIIDSVYYDSVNYNNHKLCRSASSYYNIYGDSIGKVYDLIYYDASTNTTDVRYLVYYNKSGESWGTMLPISIIDIEPLAYEISVYPIPASNTLNVSFGDIDSKLENISILSSIGALLQNMPITNSKNMYSIDISNLTPGIYFIQFKIGDDLINRKFIKN